MRALFCSAVKRRTIAVTLSLAASVGIAEPLEQGPSYSPSKEWALIDKGALGKLQPEASLGDFYVVRASEITSSNAHTKVSQAGLTLMQAGPGIFAISDASILVIARDERSLTDLLLDYSLTARHRFTATPVAVVQLGSLGQAEQALLELSDDPRVRLTELNLQTFSDLPQ
jgi:hypothetical protein